MLLKSLQYFWLRVWGASRHDHRIRISGETYWLYRLHAELTLIVVLGVGVLGALILADAPELEFGNRVGPACAFAFVAILELVRLRIELREQREFAELFYG